MTKEEMFIKAICKALPEKCDFFKGELMAWIGWVDEDEIEELRFSSSRSFEEYVSKYRTFVQRMEKELAVLEKVKDFQEEEIYKILRYLDDSYKELAMSGILDVYRLDEENNLPKGISEKEFKTFWDICQKHL